MSGYIINSGKNKKKSKPLWLEYGQAILLAILLALIIRTFVIQAFKIPSESMLNTLIVGDQLIATKFDYGVKIPFTNTVLFGDSNPEIGDIIIFEYPQDKSIDFIKRVVGVPGDIIEVRNKQLYRNGQAVQESYIRVDEPNRILPIRDNFGPVQVPEGKFFVMGDNRDNSMDSRFWGYVDKSIIKAKARFIYWSWTGVDNINWSRIGQSIK